jgi:hypothetical protein
MKLKEHIKKSKKEMGIMWYWLGLKLLLNIPYQIEKWKLHRKIRKFINKIK